MHFLTKISVLSLILVLPVIANADDSNFTLSTVHENIKQDYKNISHINLSAFNKLRQSGNLMIFDVRESSEYSVSHLENAKLLPPSTYANKFLARYGDQIKGKTIIFYCSVGVRSTKMANYLLKQLKNKGANQVYNLEGGIFAYANASQKMVNQKGETKYVHPYNAHWGSLLNSKDIWKYKP